MVCARCKKEVPDNSYFCNYCGKKLSVNKATQLKQSRRPKGSGCISKLSGARKKPFRAIKNKVCIGTFETQKEASLHLLKFENQIVTEIINITLNELFEKYKKTDKYKNLSAAAKNGYLAAWKRLQHLANKKVTDIKALDYQSCIEKVKSENLSRDTCEKVRSLISVLCQFAIKLEIINKNYADTLELPEKTKLITRRNFTDEEILTLFYNDHDETARIILCLLYTGIREEEFFSMLKANVNLSERYMVGGSKTKAGKNRIIPIRTEIIDYIKSFYNASTNEYLVCTSNGKKINRANFVNRKFYPLLDKLGIPYKNEKGQNILTLYRTRHTYIAESIKAGVKPEVLQKAVGHANYSTSVDKYNEYFDLDYILSQIQVGL